MERGYTETLSRNENFDLTYQIFDRDVTIRNTGYRAIHDADALVQYVMDFHKPYDKHQYVIRDAIYDERAMVINWQADIAGWQTDLTGNRYYDRFFGEGIYWLLYQGDKVKGTWQVFAVASPKAG